MPGSNFGEHGSTTPRLDHRVITMLRGELAEVAEHTIAAVTAEVPAYGDAFGGPMGRTIEQAVQMALAGFLRLASREAGDPGTPMSSALDGAYRLGQGEARNGRSVEALLSAYRVGARVAWRELAATAVANDLPADAVASFAELVFAYIDELSAASVAGHNDQTDSFARVRERDLDRLGQALLRGDPADALHAAAAQVEWTPPTSLTAVILPDAQVRPALLGLPAATLEPSEAAEPPGEGLAVLLVPDAGGPARRGLLTTVAGRGAVVGPPRAWIAVRSSYLRALRALPLVSGRDTVDTEEHLAALVLDADPEARADLRTRALAPLAGLRPATAEKLAETLREWLLHHGRRDDVATALFVHPQTVRYRMGQLRDAYGDALDDPRTLLELTIALAEPAS
ncbi:MAG: helix-turn-helix domain-containing protein [Nocardioides sp.]|uniref:PucR family transcriptional regulator n=1 Tax=Nocardioides sp. TaxID=35761 RepID=UPI0039E37D19